MPIKPKMNAVIGTGPTDNGDRGQYGVTTSVVEVNEETVRLNFDDVQSVEKGPKRAWMHSSFYTSIDLDREAFEECALSETELARIGQALLVRIRARQMVGGD